MSNKIKLVKLNSTLKSFSHVEDIKREIKEHLIARFGASLDKVSQDPSFLELVCCILEALYKVPKNDKNKIDKKRLVIDLLIEIVPALNNQRDIEHLAKSIDYLHSKGFIVGVTKTAEIFDYVKGCFFSKK